MTEDAGQSGPVVPEPIFDAPEILAVLQEACRDAAPVRVYLPTSDSSFNATFGMAYPDKLVLTVDHTVRVQALPILGLCSVYFSQALLSCTGFTRLLAVDNGLSGECASVTLEVPNHIVRMQARAAARIPIPQGSGFSVFVFHNGKLLRPKPVNISTSGMMVDFGEAVTGIEIDAVVQVQASLSGLSLNLPGLVRWTEGGACGVFFNAGPEGSNVLCEMVRILSGDQAARAA
jgi:hypothetical protein